MSEVIDAEIIQEAKTEKKQKATANEVAIRFKDDGLVQFEDHKELLNAALMMVTLKIAPDHLKTRDEVAMAMIFCQQRNLPYSSMNEIGVVKGKPGAFGSLVTALAQRDPAYGETIVQYVNKEMNPITLKNKNLSDDVYACVIQIKKKNSEIWNEYFFTVDEAKKAGLMGSNTYQKYLKDMLFHRAKFRAFKTEYAAALNGVESYEILKQEADVKDVSPLNELNQKLGLTEEEREI